MSKQNAKNKDPVQTTQADKWRIFIGILLGVVIIALCLLRSCGGDPVKTGNKLPTDLDPNVQAGDFEGLTEEEIIAKLNQQVEEGMMNISMGVNPIFETGSSAGTLKIFNDYINRHPQVVEIYTKLPGEDGTMQYTRIYQSGLIPVGSRIETAPLDVNLAPGNYECIARFYNVDEETGQDLGKAQAEITISVLG